MKERLGLENYLMVSGLRLDLLLIPLRFNLNSVLAGSGLGLDGGSLDASPRGRKPENPDKPHVDRGRTCTETQD